ncbi:MAG: hypothetical protein NTY88_13965 [Bacteroidetes bacterium]|nr:hypothetical protein [Bacteroidota bacterium]
MNKSIKGILPFICCLSSIVYCLSLFSCKDKKDDYTIDYLTEYAPLDSGHYVIYDVDSITYHYANPVYTRDTARYQLKEEIGDTTYDNLNQLCYQLDLYRRADSNAAWSFDRRWLVKRTPTAFEKTELDLKFVKLIFPPRYGDSWNGNSYLPTTTPYQLFQNWDYKYTEVNYPRMYGSFSFDRTLTVSEVNDSNLLEKVLRKEVYALHTGMIYQEWEHLEKGNVLRDWQTGPESGFRIRMKIAGHN